MVSIDRGYDFLLGRDIASCLWPRTFLPRGYGSSNETLRIVSYSSVHSMLNATFAKIFNIEFQQSASLNGNVAVQQTTYDFLFVFYYKYASISYQYRNISTNLWYGSSYCRKWLRKVIQSEYNNKTHDFQSLVIQAVFLQSPDIGFAKVSSNGIVGFNVPIDTL